MPSSRAIHPVQPSLQRVPSQRQTERHRRFEWPVRRRRPGRGRVHENRSRFKGMETALVAINTGSFRYQTRSKKVEQEASLLPFASPTAFPFSPPFPRCRFSREPAQINPGCQDARVFAALARKRPCLDCRCFFFSVNSFTPAWLVLRAPPSSPSPAPTASRAPAMTEQLHDSLQHQKQKQIQWGKNILLRPFY